MQVSKFEQVWIHKLFQHAAWCFTSHDGRTSFSRAARLKVLWMTLKMPNVNYDPACVWKRLRGVWVVRPSVRPTVRPSDRPSDRPSVRPSVRLSVHPLPKRHFLKNAHAESLKTKAIVKRKKASEESWNRQASLRDQSGAFRDPTRCNQPSSSYESGLNRASFKHHPSINQHLSRLLLWAIKDASKLSFNTGNRQKTCLFVGETRHVRPDARNTRLILPKSKHIRNHDERGQTSQFPPPARRLPRGGLWRDPILK